jgi:hypothetical protein
MRPLLAGALLITVLVGGFFIGAINTLTREDMGVDW